MPTLKYYVLTVYVAHRDVYRSTVVTSLRAVKSLIDGLQCQFWVYESKNANSNNLALITYSWFLNERAIRPLVWMRYDLRKASSKVGTLAHYSVGHVSRFTTLAMAG
jgi:hypothetical protein